MGRALIVLPDDSAAPIAEAIHAAQESLRVKMFVFSAPELLKAVIAAKHRGVTVRVMLNAARRNGEQDNNATRRTLEHAGIEVKSANPAFAVTHEKSMVIDESCAYVSSFNWTMKNLAETRDYSVVTTHGHDVAEMIECFEADWHRQPFTSHAKSHLVWCPGPGRDRVCQFIDDARHLLVVQNERFQDMLVIEHLVRAKKRGVKVHVMTRSPHTLKQDKLVEGLGGLRIMDDVGIEIRKTRGLRLHGKALIADGVAAIVGSINFAAGSFDERRELAIELRDEEVLDRLNRVTHHDWRHSRGLDLSDAGVMSDLEDRAEVAERLALGGERSARS